MKKFTKISLLAALGMFLAGFVMFVAFGMMGGFRQIDERNWNGITFGTPSEVVDYIKGKNTQEDAAEEDSESGIMRINALLDDEWYSNTSVSREEWEKMTALPEGQTRIAEAGEVQNLKMVIAASDCKVEKSEDNAIWIEVERVEDMVRYSVKGDVLRIAAMGKERKAWSGRVSAYEIPEITLYLPDNKEYGEVEIELLAGGFEAEELKTQKLTADSGAANVVIKKVQTSEIDMKAGVGSIEIEELKAESALFDIGAGSLTAEKADISGDTQVSVGMGSAVLEGVLQGKCAIECGMGDVTLEGTLQNDCMIDCGMGSVQLQLDGREEDFDYKVSHGEGNIDLGSRTMAMGEQEIDNGADKKITIDCGMGTIDIDFD